MTPGLRDAFVPFPIWPLFPLIFWLFLNLLLISEVARTEEGYKCVHQMTIISDNKSDEINLPPNS